MRYLIALPLLVAAGCAPDNSATINSVDINAAAAQAQGSVDAYANGQAEATPSPVEPPPVEPTPAAVSAGVLSPGGAFRLRGLVVGRRGNGFVEGRRHDSSP